MSSISSRFFTTSKGRKYEIIATEYGKDKNVLSAIDTVKNQEGKKKRMTRSQTLKLIRS